MPDSISTSFLRLDVIGKDEKIFLHPEGGSQKATLLVVILVGISSPGQ